MRKRVFCLLIYFLGGLLIFHLGRNLWSLYLASKRISREEKRLVRLIAENEELRKQLRDWQSEEFVEREARDRLGLAKEGEAVVIIDEGALKKSITSDTGTTSTTGNEEKAVWREWVDLFVEE